MSTALLIGATGLVGDYLLRQLLADEQFTHLKVFTRRPTGYQNPRLEEYIVDFDQPRTWNEELRGDVLFSSLGTTLSQAGGQQEQYLVDYTYQFQAAQAAAENGVPTYVLVSSAGADAESLLFYNRMKGELERDIKRLPFQRIRIIQPGILAGPRTEQRLGEKVGLWLATAASTIPLLHSYRPIHARTVARAMHHAALDETPGVQTDSLEQVFTRAGKEGS